MSRLLVFVVVSALLCVACGDWPWETPPTGPSQTVNQTVIVQPAAPASATPSGTPVPGNGNLVRPAFVRVGIFGQACPPEIGATIPPNTASRIIRGCVATFTATPKRSDGSDQTEGEHGPLAQWTVTGGACADLNADPSNPNGNVFNREIRGASAGACQVCAIVQGVQGCARDGDGNPGVTVVNP
jgi:hypothetical protein